MSEQYQELTRFRFRFWNPWIAKAKAMADFGDDEYQRMVCVESGNWRE